MRLADWATLHHLPELAVAEFYKLVEFSANRANAKHYKTLIDKSLSEVNIAELHKQFGLPLTRPFACDSENWPNIVKLLAFVCELQCGDGDSVCLNAKSIFHRIWGSDGKKMEMRKWK